MTTLRSGTSISSDHAPEKPALVAMRHIGKTSTKSQMQTIIQCQMLSDPKVHPLQMNFKGLRCRRLTNSRSTLAAIRSNENTSALPHSSNHECFFKRWPGALLRFEDWILHRKYGGQPNDSGSLGNLHYSTNPKCAWINLWRNQPDHTFTNHRVHLFSLESARTSFKRP